MKIALVGKMRSGKNTVGDYLVSNYGFNEFAFGTGIGEVIKTYFPEELKKGKPRHFYQHIGQSMRELDKDVWVKYLLNSINEFQYSYTRNFDKEANIVITDSRQYNEVAALRREGYLIVKVVADEEKRINRIIDSGDNFDINMLFHDTELQVDTVVADIEIHNNGTLEELYKASDWLVEYYNNIWRGNVENKYVHGKERNSYIAELLQTKGIKIL